MRYAFSIWLQGEVQMLVVHAHCACKIRCVESRGGDVDGTHCAKHMTGSLIFGR